MKNYITYYIYFLVYKQIMVDETVKGERFREIKSISPFAFLRRSNGI